ncbi:MAG: alpha/beta hydrolase [Bacillota bacterium]|nr:alpha/beta hydrolase [Bacillota bacterium]
MNYFSFGTGKRAFIMLPGISLKSVLLSAEAVAAAYADFGKDYTVYLFDAPEEIPEDCTIAFLADSVAETMQKLGISDADIFGCSMGGMIAQQLTVNYPQLVHKAVFASTCARPGEMGIATLSGWREFALKGDRQSLNRGFAQNVYSPEFYALYKDVFAAMENDGTDEELRRFVLKVNACLRFDILGELDKISRPVLVIGARGDHVLSGECSVEIAEKIGCELYMYEGYGHAVYDEAPDYKARLLRFFAD